MHRHNFPLGLAEVHPRIRGEYNNPIQTKKCMKGSPPHPRGILSAELPPGTGRQVHPRIRGEYGILSSTSTVLPGSPPHPRGIYFDMQDSNIQKRFTPASAGNIHWYSLINRTVQVHPRIRGEDSSVIRFPYPSVGSPPHPRGILRIVGRYGRRIGFTPASAGNIIPHH